MVKAHTVIDFLEPLLLSPTAYLEYDNFLSTPKGVCDKYA